MIDSATYLASYQQLMNNHFAEMGCFLKNERVRNVVYDYKEAKKTKPVETINVFRMVSDYYYRENFHSDVIRYFLSPSAKHNEGLKFLYTFIDFINENFKKVNIPKDCYKSARVEREKGKIDIRIVTEKPKKRCIIIENKMHNADDMERQLPRYYDNMRCQEYEIDAIVYLPLDSSKRPVQSSWSEEDKKNVLPLLCTVPAYQKNGLSLVNGWILPCTMKTNNIDCISVLRQYAEEIKQLKNDDMDNVFMSKFYDELQQCKGLETAQSVRNMMAELPCYLADRLVEKFRAGENNYGYRVWKYKFNFCGILYEYQGTEYKIDIWTSENGYTIYVFGQDNNNNGNRVLDWADGMKSLSSFERIEKNEYKKGGFTFYDEDKLIECVNEVNKEMYERVKAIKG